MLHYIHEGPYNIRLIVPATEAKFLHSQVSSTLDHKIRLHVNPCVQERRTEIERIVKMIKEKHEGVAALLSADTMHKPFDLAELSFGVIGPYCQVRG